MDYKETLHLPTTDFPMRANLQEREPERLAFWREMGLQAKLDAMAGERDSFVLHDGPPYANGHIHLGTALNKILKDIVVKSKIMHGMHAPFVPGWDCHGLPIEQKVAQELRKKKQEASPVEIRRLCADYARQFVDIQREEFQRLGCLGDWDNPYLTLKPEYEAAQLRLFAKLVADGHVYRSLKPVYWCPAYETALAEAEVEYHDHTSPSIYVLFPSIDLDSVPEIAAHGPYDDQRSLRVLIWTTTPWTLPANLGITFHPKLTYALVESPEWGVMIMAEELVERVVKESGLGEHRILGTFPGAVLDRKRCRHPFLEHMESLCMLGEYVTLEQGSGCVHTAPGHGQDDYITGQRYGLPVYSPVDSRGCFTDEFPLCAGVPVEKANPRICELLTQHGALLWKGSLTHQYPHDWRDKKPIIFRATPQWFISLEHDNLRNRLLAGVDEVTWVPRWGHGRIGGMIANRSEWCISRQRAWGVPIPAVFDDTTGEVLLDADVVLAAADVVERFGTDAWFEAHLGQDTGGARALLAAVNNALPGREGHDVVLGADILDVWFDSGVSHTAVLKRRDNLRYPADMYLEGSDQHRGWFQSSLTTAVAAGYGVPYKTVLTHGYVVDEKGRKMSKSLGNVIAPQQVIDKFGADILRLWVSSEDFRSDISLSWDIVKRLAETFRKVRNTCRYLMANLHDYQPGMAVPVREMPEIDRWLLLRLRRVEQDVSAAYQAYEFHRLYQMINNLCVIELSGVYLDVLKDRMYCQARESQLRRAGQTVMSRALVSLVRMIAPVLSFTAEDIWQELRRMELVKEESVFLAGAERNLEWPADEDLVERWDRLLRLRDEVNKLLDLERKAKSIGKSLEAEVVLYTPDENLRALIARQRDAQPIGDNLESLFIVSGVTLADSAPDWDGVFHSEAIDGLVIGVRRAQGTRCERCWNVRDSVGASTAHHTLCARCAAVLEQVGA